MAFLESHPIFVIRGYKISRSLEIPLLVVVNLFAIQSCDFSYLLNPCISIDYDLNVSLFPHFLDLESKENKTWHLIFSYIKDFISKTLLYRLIYLISYFKVMLLTSEKYLFMKSILHFFSIFKMKTFKISLLQFRKSTLWFWSVKTFNDIWLICECSQVLKSLCIDSDKLFFLIIPLL